MRCKSTVKNSFYTSDRRLSGRKLYKLEVGYLVCATCFWKNIKSLSCYKITDINFGRRIFWLRVVRNQFFS